MTQEASKEIKYYVTCPHCNNRAGRIDHLFDGKAHQWGPWSCDKCGGYYEGTTFADSHLSYKVEVTPVQGKKVECHAILQYNDLVILVNWFYNDVYEEETMRYYFEEHTCPVNFLRVADVYGKNKKGELYDDPHGVFTFKGIIPIIEDDDERLEAVEKAIKEYDAKHSDEQDLDV